MRRTPAFGRAVACATLALLSCKPSSTPFAGGADIYGACPAPLKRCMAFTFDDGPNPTVTPQILAILAEHHLHATFFVEGQHLDPTTDPAASTNRELLRKAVREGHIVGNHTFDHPVLDDLDDAHIGIELDRTSDLIADTIGLRPGFVRAPFGKINTPRTFQAVARRGYTLTGWTLDPKDWAEHDPVSVLRNFREALQANPEGGVLLMHDVHMHTPAAFRLILAEIDRQNALARQRGEPEYAILTLDRYYHPRRH